jgi:putative ABC transport system permease protein
MSPLRRFWNTLRRSRLDDELRQEVETHLALIEEEERANGLSPQEAHHRARSRFGSPLVHRQRALDAVLATWLEDSWQDVRFAARQLRRAPGFAVVAIVTLGLGIGATTAIYSIADTILLQPLPFPDSDRLVRVVENFTGGAPGRVFQRGVTHQEYVEWKARATTLTDAAAVMPGPRAMRTAAGIVRLWGAAVSDNTFSMLGARPALGRTLGPSDERGPEVVVLGFEAWQRYFASDPSVLGRTIEIRGGGFPAPPAPARLLTVVGVLSAGFYLPNCRCDFYTPIALELPGITAAATASSRPPPRVAMLAKLNAGVSLDAALQEANVIGTAIAAPRPANAPPLPGLRFELLQLKEQIVRELRPAFRVLLAAVAIVLLIVCANVANLLLARGTARQREIAIRMAIGASRGRILRHVLTECALLAFSGALAGAALGALGVTLVKQLAAVEAPGILRLMFGETVLPRAEEISVNLRFLMTAFGLAAVTCAIFALLPALQLSRTNHLSAAAAPGSGTGSRETSIRGALVVGQLMMATILLVGAGLLVRSFVKLTAMDKGYDASNVVTFQLLVPGDVPIGRKAELIDSLLTRVRARPNVQAAGFARHGILLTEALVIGTFVPPGRTLDEMRNEPQRPRVRAISSDFLAAMGVPLLGGREFNESDGPGAPTAVVVNQSVAQRYFGSRSPVGQPMEWHAGKAIIPVTIVGVASDIRQESLDDERYPEIFVDYRQALILSEGWGESTAWRNESFLGFMSFAVRTRDEAASAVPVVREIVNAVDPGVGIDSIVPMTRMVANVVARPRFYAVLLGVFAAVAALLAAIGIYGVLSYAVVQRTREIGIRMALGAERARVLILVLRKGVILTTIGITLGVAAAAAITRLLQGMLFGITPLDPTTFLSVSLMFGLVATVASYLPARRATMVNPLVALRNDG